ncbi:hypothetical protein FOL47_008872 [Perkinsus chesapeaki]|uniref:Uncharacterized protein n=1 Tax=Perkinsus chesapeaki TaxID=330153 RepID=A0A7J6MSW3_PERCH|nr:hypothetical protein FOL47_008872 [Perkinsus chesapeaki]
MCERCVKYYKVDFTREVANLSLPKVLCPACTRRLKRFEDDPTSFESWREGKRYFVDALQYDYDSVNTRSDACSEEAPCKVCSIVLLKKSNTLQAKHSNRPKKGRPIEQSPVKFLCNKCGLPEEGYDHSQCHKKRRGQAAGREFAKRVEASGFTKHMVREHLREVAMSGVGGSESSQTPLRTGIKLDGHTFLGLSPARYDGQPNSQVCLSTESARDLLRLGHLGLGKDSARQLCSILGREGICFPTSTTTSGCSSALGGHRALNTRE